jgi:signal transduction histidine kinase/predicted small metal-binding protein
VLKLVGGTQDVGTMDVPQVDAVDLGGDVRATAVLAVLAGVAPETVARRYGVAEIVLDRWVSSFVEAGRAGMSTGSPGSGDLHRDRHLGLIAHELRSPLAMIRGWVDVLTHSDDDPEVRTHAIRSISAQVDRMRRLADDALDATGVALGQLQLDRTPMPLSAAVSRVVDARAGGGVRVDIAEDATVHVDLDRFGQILDNLLDNARKHGDGSTTLQVRRHGAYGELVVTSLGDPIPPQVARRMFEPFERGRTMADGLGLGLYVCRSLTVAHGGQIGLRVDDEGNHFWLRLPIHEGDRAMTYEFACGDVMPGCAATFEAAGEDELLSAVADHAEADHGIQEITPEVAQAVTAKIRTR